MPTSPAASGSSSSGASGVRSPCSSRTRFSSVRRYIPRTRRPSAVSIRSPRRRRSPGVATCRPASSASRRCSNHAEFSSPSVSTNRSPSTSGADASITRRSAAATCCCAPSCRPPPADRRTGSTSSTTSAAARAYATPEGTRTLSSSTRNVPWSSRTTSSPASPIRAPAWRWIPTRSFSKYDDPLTTCSGTTPSATARWSPYTSSRNASSARTRCPRPWASSSHSAPVRIRGTGSTVNRWPSSPPKATPRPSTRSRTRSPSARRSVPPRWSSTSRWCGRGLPSRSKASSNPAAGS